MKEKKDNCEKTGSQDSGMEKSNPITLGFSPNANSSVADLKNGHIVRIRPLHYDWKYDPKQFNAWKMEARGKSLEPGLKTLIPPYSLAYKKRVYSPNRILYPLKRVDWDPDGDRNAANRGVSKYERISWDEALNYIVKELKRIQKQYGTYAVLCQQDGHGESKNVHTAHACSTRLMQMLGGYTLQTRNPDSWEGWYWGAKHVWGCEPVGQMGPVDNVMLDISENTDLILFWGSDPETTPWAFDGQMASRLCYWWSDLGI
jgi:anaerobic selenocysteine-containing dehydrogenase